jgi:glycolate oxidase
MSERVMRTGEQSKMFHYQPVTPEIIAELSAIVGHENILSGSAVPVSAGYDAGTRRDAHYLPEVVAVPADAAQVAAILKLANRSLVPVTPRGGGTGLAGGAVPLAGGILLDLGRLDRILAIDPTARYAEVQPGVKTTALQQAAQEQGLLYAGDPCSNDDCVIGGNIATNAGGNRAVKYGVTSDQVLELEVVTPRGERTVVGSLLKKNSTGYNLVRLYAGAEGTLGIITRATLRLHRLAPLIPDFLVVMPDLHAAIGLVEELRDDRIIDPIVLELIDRRTAQAMERYHNSPIFANPPGDILVVQFEAHSTDELNHKQTRLEQTVFRFGAFSVTRAADSEALWSARRAWGKALEVELPVAAGDDLVVPVEHLSRFITRLQELVTAYSFDFRLAGHAGDGNMHLRIVPGSVPLTEWPDRYNQFREELHRSAYDLGGRLSGEHGIGYKKKAALARLIDPVELSLMRAIKLAFDPNLILNPGKIFDPA